MTMAAADPSDAGQHGLVDREDAAPSDIAGEEDVAYLSLSVRTGGGPGTVTFSMSLNQLNPPPEVLAGLLLRAVFAVASDAGPAVNAAFRHQLAEKMAADAEREPAQPADTASVEPQDFVRIKP